MRENLIKIYGRVANFSNQSIANAEVEIVGLDFKTIYKTKSNKDGRYEILVKQKTYFA